MAQLFSSDPMLQIRKLREEDLSFCTALVEQAGWNQKKADWYRVMSLDPEGCFLVESDGLQAATIVFTRFNDVAWISMVLVDKRYRGQGIGQKMFGYVLNKLRVMGVGTIRLDATAMGVNLYKKYGFQEEYELVRLICEQVSNTGIARAKKHRPVNIELMAQLDYKITGTDRIKLIGQLSREDGSKIHIESRSDSSISGYAVIRPGRIASQIGPCIAKSPDVGIALLDTALESITGQNVIVDIPANNVVALQWANDHKFIEQRRFIRMYTGKKIEDQPNKIFTSFGPEKG